LRPAHKRTLVVEVVDHYRVSERSACQIIQISRTSYRYRSIRDEQVPLRLRINAIAKTMIRYGYKFIVLLRREGWTVNHKRVYRIYCEEGLNLRARKPKWRKSTAQRMQRPPAPFVNESWSMDFVTDSLFNGHRFRSLTIVDNFSRECLAIEVGQHIKGKDVVRVVERIKVVRSTPGHIRVDNGPEFISKELDKWAYENNVTLDFSRPGKPLNNAYIESFNGRLQRRVSKCQLVSIVGGRQGED
jgi:putative transposase